MGTRGKLFTTCFGLLFAMTPGKTTAPPRVTPPPGQGYHERAERGSGPALTRSTVHGPLRLPERGLRAPDVLLPSDVLYDQTDSPSIEGLSSQNFEAAFDAYDDQAADDFVVPAGQSWRVDTVVAPGSYSENGVPASIHVTFSHDAAGVPGATACDYPALAFLEPFPGTFVITLPGGCLLASGAYWVSVQVNMDNGCCGQWYWASRSIQSNQPAVWRNPGGGFGTSCASYAPQTACGQTAPDELFELDGSVFRCTADADCNDGNPCTGVEACVSGACVAGTPVSCDDGQICTVDTCVRATGQCRYAPNRCDDGDACTLDSCNEVDGCNHADACIEVCDPNAISILDHADALPYPAAIEVADLPGAYDLARVRLLGLSHTFPDDIDMLLVGPGGQRATIVSDVGGSPNAVGVNLTLTDPAPAPLPDHGPLVSGTFKPTNVDNVDTFPAPAPAPTGGSALSAFHSMDPNGTWSLFAVDDAAGASGTLAGGWCLELIRLVCKTDFVCEDGDPCTTDTCNLIDLTCQHAPPACDDGDECTLDACDPDTGGCVFPPLECDDGNACTDDSCDSQLGCVATADDTNTCSDGNACTAPDVCRGGACTCDNHGACLPGTVTSYSNATAVAIPTGPAVISSSITVAGAQPFLNRVRLTTGILHTNNADLDITLTSPSGTVVNLSSDNGATNDDVFNGTLWDDKADPVNQVPFAADTFSASSLATDTVYSVGVVKTTLVPEEALAAFRGENPNGTWTMTFADDGPADSGTLDSWSLEITTTECAISCTVSCDDENVCTNDECQPQLGCLHANNQASCSDASACTGGDHCFAGSCIGTAISCDDANACTDDACDAVNGCTHTATDCNDGNACTADSCDAGNGCVHTPGAVSELNNTVRVGKSGVTAQLSWIMASGATTSDVVRGVLTALPVGPGGADEVCLGDNIALTSVSDGSLPAVGTALWYVVRGSNACFVSSYGTQSSGAPRVSTTCP